MYVCEIGLVKAALIDCSGVLTVSMDLFKNIVCKHFFEYLNIIEEMIMYEFIN